MEMGVRAELMMGSWYTPAGLNLFEKPCPRLWTTWNLRLVHRKHQLNLNLRLDQRVCALTASSSSGHEEEDKDRIGVMISYVDG